LSSRVLGAVAALVAALASVPVRADAPNETSAAASAGFDDARTSEAREAFKLGAELAREARWDEARVMFSRSNALKPHPVTIYNLAFCDRAMGRPARALELFQRALDVDHAGPDHLADELIGVTRRYLAEASARVVQVRWSGVEPSELRVDGRPLEAFVSDGQMFYVLAESPDPPAATRNEAAALLLDPGTHVFVARRPGSADVVETRAVAAGEQLRINFKFEAPPVPHRAARAAEKRRSSSSFPGRGYAYAALGVGAAGIVVGGVAGTVALAARSKLRDECVFPGHACSRRSEDDIQRLQTSSSVATVAFVVGAVGAAGGITLLALAPVSRPNQSARLELRLGAAGISLSGQLR